MNLKNKKTIDKILLTLAIFTILFILLLSVNAFYNGSDDFDFIMQMRKGILQNCIYGYNNWDGRFLTIGALVQGYILVNLPIELVILIWSLCFLGSGFLLFHFINSEIKINTFSKTKVLIFTFFFAILFWLGSFFHFRETIYWGTGGVYSFNLLLGVIWIYFYLKIQNSNAEIGQKTGFILFSIIAAASTQNLSIALITLALITIILDFLNHNLINFKLNFLILFGLVFGILFITLAPGNQSRIDMVNSAGKPNYTLFYFIYNFAKMLYHYLKWSSLLIVLSTICGLIISFSVNKIQSFDLKLLKFRFNFKTFLTETKWLLVALSTITPFLTIPAVLSARTSIYFMFFMFVFITTFTYKFIIKIAVIKEDFVYKKISNSLILFLLIGLISFVGYNFKKGIELKTSVTAREKILKNAKNKTAYIHLIDTNLNAFCFKVNDYNTVGAELPKSIIDSQEKYYHTKIKVIE